MGTSLLLGGLALAGLTLPLPSASAAGATVSPASSTYSVVFEETGLASGTAWGVQIGGSDALSSANTVGLYLPNGTYAFSIDPAAGYAATPPTGEVTVDGVGQVVNVAFTGTAPGAPSAPGPDAGLTLASQVIVTVLGLAALVTIVTVWLSFRYRRGPRLGWWWWWYP